MATAAKNKEQATKIKLSVCLEDQSLFHLNFLHKISNQSELLQKPNILRYILYRYETLWLPLAAKHNKEVLSAPLDIEWIWHCHMLSPKAYAADCERLVGVVVEHTSKKEAGFQRDQSKASQYWSNRYPSEPFLCDFSRSDLPEVKGFESKLSYDVVDAASRQQHFFYQVSLPHFRDRSFLALSVKRYKQFLYLKTLLPHEFLVPCYDIDLIWHSHQLNPVTYAADMKRIIGHLFNHDDTVSDRSEGSKQHIGDMKTREHWKTHFNENFANFGSMYRGMPPGGILYQLTMKDVRQFCTNKVDITIDKVYLNLGDPDTNLKHEKVKLRVIAAAGATCIKMSLN